MLSFRQIPLFRLILPFIGGILLGIYLGGRLFTSSLFWYTFAAIALIGFLAMVFAPVKKYRLRWVYGTSLQIVLLCLGYLIVTIKSDKCYPHHVSKLAEEKRIYEVLITESLEEKTKTFKAVGEFRRYFEGGSAKHVQGKAIFYIAKDSISESIQYGDVLLMQCRLQDIRPPQNPAQFNYKQYLHFHQVYKQAFVREGQWQFTGQNEGNWVLRSVAKVRNKMLEELEERGLSEDELAVASALILGYKEDLSNETVRAFAGAGAMHVLAVSGLHVGIIYMVISALLKFIERLKYGNLVKAVLLILFLAFYAMLTGLSPSVLRASTMFSFIIIAQSFKYYTNIYNTLAVSAFVLLIINPFLIMQVGFQLSYLAVIGIVYLQPKMYEWITVNNWLLDKAWALTCVSVAAQLATFPLGLLYFHQFPNYFMFSNLVVIPMATLIIYSGMAVFAFSWLDVVADLLAMVLKLFVYILNTAVTNIEKLPYSITGGIDISIFETYLIYAIIFGFTTFLVQRNFRLLFFTLGTLVIFSGSQLWEGLEQQKQRQFIVYNVKGISAYDFIDGRQNVFLSNEELIGDEDQMLFNVKHNWWKLGLSDQRQLSFGNMSPSGAMGAVYIENNFIQFLDKRIVVLDENFELLESPEEKIKLDYLIIRNEPYLDIDLLQANFEFKLVIIDSSNSYYKRKLFKRLLDQSSIPYYDVNERGAFVMEF